MLQIRKILLRGAGLEDAVVQFYSGANVLAGESDTGKSFLLECINFILGADKLKHVEEAVHYTHLVVEFVNSKDETITLVRPTDGGNLMVYRVPIEDISGNGEVIAPTRKGTSKGPDVTSVLLPFAGIKEARLRKNVGGETQRFTIRTIEPLFLIDEVSVIDQHSPVTGKPGFGDTARKRAISYVLTGIDDESVAAGEKNEIVKARLKAQLELVGEMLQPLNERFALPRELNVSTDDTELDSLIGSLTDELEGLATARDEALEKSQEATRNILKADSQLLGIRELLSRYQLLDERYTSDLDRLDFISESSFYFEALQEVPCPVCDQIMAPGHSHSPDSAARPIRESAVAEAAKIHAHRTDLAAAIRDLKARQGVVEFDKMIFDFDLDVLNAELNRTLAPRLEFTTERLEQLMSRHTERETTRVERERWQSLVKRQNDINSALAESGASKKNWSGIPPKELGEFCAEIQAVLVEWAWKGTPHVQFDEKAYDIVVDGKPRQSSGKGVRAILYAAFAIGLLRYCAKNNRPHPGVIVIDSPLTSYKSKKSETVKGENGQIDAGIEAAFWKSLANTSKDIQIIVIENKEPPSEIAEEVHYQWFAGENAKADDRAGFIPTKS
ncbi:conserved hypothetical protein [Paraburkholderia ribeironis]|uniref:Rad50/SbcC-type AAA domain-containing protein n=1 Tax=Paraburkholderia ribeironis TaxID=1247936 RepID=A0A1N7SLB7_9BURK|nr:hypothetical protein [Paraburkholderia ribeironis]SIT48186.1 conserved hypothetical protein [Paraburkholderia ribeironis]